MESNKDRIGWGRVLRPQCIFRGLSIKGVVLVSVDKILQGDEDMRCSVGAIHGRLQRNIPCSILRGADREFFVFLWKIKKTWHLTILIIKKIYCKADRTGVCHLLVYSPKYPKQLGEGRCRALSLDLPHWLQLL